MTRSLILVISIVCAFGGSSMATAGEHNCLILEGQMVCLGDSRAKAKDILRTCSVSDYDDKLLIAKYNKDDIRYIGDIEFINDKTVKIHKHWSDYFADSEALLSFESLYGVLEDFAGHDGLSASISTDRINHPPNKVTELIRIDGQNRWVTIVISDSTISKNRKVIEIDEFLVSGY